MVLKSKRSLFVFLFAAMPVYSAAQIERIAVIEAWPAVSQLISYDNRIWFVNSQPYKDNNAADIYSYAPSTGELQYERSLFSQDVGNPVVYNGLLHWPFEDPRRSAGTGEFAVTDGTRWQWRYMQSGSVMHVHAMDVCDEQLVAVTGSWTGQLHIQQPDEQWKMGYDYAAGDASFSRLVNVAEFDNKCVVGAAARGKSEAKLFSINNSRPGAVSGWPVSDRVDGLTTHKGRLFAFTDTGNDRSLMQYDGRDTKEIVLPESHRPRALHSNGEKLWLVTQYFDEESSRGHLWVYDGKGAFESLEDFDYAPVSLTSHDNRIYVGTYHRSGGALWQYSVDQKSERAVVEKSRLPDNPVTSVLDETLVSTLYAELLSLINDPNLTADYARGLRRKIGRHPQIKKPEFGAAVTKLLSVPIEGGTVTMFNRRTLSRQTLIRWYLLTTLSINGHGRVNPEWITAVQPVDEGNRSGKLFDTAVAATVAVGWIGQDDKPTINALMQRLNNNSNAGWVKADVIGALTALSDQRFAYDIAAWNQWWKNQ